MIRRGFGLIVCVCASQAATPVDQNTIRRRGTGLRAFNPGKSIRRWGRQPFRPTPPLIVWMSFQWHEIDTKLPDGPAAASSLQTI